MNVAAADFNTAPSSDDFTNWEPEPGKPFSLHADLPFVYDLIPRDIRPPEPRWGWKGVVKSLAVHAGMPLTRLLAPGSKGMCLYTSWGGMGDEILHTAVVRELAKKLGGPVWVLSLHPWVYREHRAVKGVIPPDGHVIAWAQQRAKVLFGGYGKRQRERNKPEYLQHQIALICEELGVRGEIELKPEVSLTEQEIVRARSYKDCIVVHSSILGARYPLYNKQWPPERMAEVVRALSRNHRVVQIGGKRDPFLPGAKDLRGCHDLRHVAAVLANAGLFVGIEGFHTHLARAVNCRSVVLYGGYSHPDETGYPCNENLFTELPCSPCYEPSGCNFRRKCLDLITPSDVLTGVERALARMGKPLEVERVCIPSTR
jgi:hypothetical protein